MNKKWLKIGGFLGGLMIFIYLLVDLFLLDFVAEKRYLIDKKATIDNFSKHEQKFNEINQLSKLSPNFSFSISTSDSIFLLLNFGKYDFFGEHQSDDSLKIILDTTLNQKNWIIKTLDVGVHLTESYARDYFYRFEKIYQLVEQVNGIRISHLKGIQLNIDYKEIYSSGFRYISFHHNFQHSTLNEGPPNGKLNDHFHWYFFDESLICWVHPHWIIP